MYNGIHEIVDKLPLSCIIFENFDVDNHYLDNFFATEDKLFLIKATESGNQLCIFNIDVIFL